MTYPTFEFSSSVRRYPCRFPFDLPGTGPWLIPYTAKRHSSRTFHLSIYPLKHAHSQSVQSVLPMFTYRVPILTLSPYLDAFGPDIFSLIQCPPGKDETIYLFPFQRFLLYHNNGRLTSKNCAFQVQALWFPHFSPGLGKIGHDFLSTK